MDVSRRYGIKKLSGVHRRTKALKKLDMSRCQLSQNGFYELIPIILKSEHVILQVEKVRDGNYLDGFLVSGQPDHTFGAEDLFWPIEVPVVKFISAFMKEKLCLNPGQALMRGK